MSDISASFDDERPFEVRSAGHKGMGAFATRDIDPGEVVLVEFTPIVVNLTEDDARDCFEMVQIYESLSEDMKRGWRSLHASTHAPSLAAYQRIFSSRQPDGTYFSEEKQDLYITLKLQIDANVFGTCTSLVGLFVDASRFNHSVSSSPRNCVHLTVPLFSSIALDRSRHLGVTDIVIHSATLMCGTETTRFLTVGLEGQGDRS